ncbi:hypothetical protein AAVH_07057 [Aphelenchoides avenae]|nr:hypothetical protein AAVH_07057 [Aphelenchus avenae]
MSDDDYEDYGDEDYQEPSTSSRPHGDASSANAAASQSSAGPSDADRNPRDTIENALRDIAQMGFSEEQREDLDAIFQQLRYFARRFAASFDQGQLRQAARIVVQQTGHYGNIEAFFARLLVNLWYANNRRHHYEVNGSRLDIFRVRPDLYRRMMARYDSIVRPQDSVFPEKRRQQ